MGRRRKVPITAISILIIGLLANLALNAASAQARWPGWLDLVRVYAWLALAIFAAALVYFTWRQAQPKKSKKRDPRKVAELLAEAVNAQWVSETKRRRVFNPYALPVQWAAADPALFTPWPVIVKQATGSPGGSPELAATWAADSVQLAGGDKELADVFGRIPTRMLVVLGEPGAGKTILLVRFVLELLSRDRPKGDRPVPIVLPMASWNPEAEDLRSWIERSIATDPVGLARLTPDDPGMAGALLNADLILPILDGFDEIPEKMRTSAIDGINEAIKPRHGLILTSRTEEYRNAVHGEDGVRMVLDGAAGIELRPLDASTVTDYLKQASNSPEIAERWDAITCTFKASNPLPVAQALTTPLMVTLARAIYNPRDNDEDAATIQHHPTELLDPDRFRKKEDVEIYLLDKFIWAAYRPHPKSSHPSRSCPWNYDQAKRWLVFLARNQQTQENGAPEIAWWKLDHAAPKYLVATVLAMTLGIAAAAGYPFVGFGIGLTTGLIVGLAVRRLASPWESKLLPSVDKGIVRGLFGGLVGGVIAGLVAAATLPNGPRNSGLGAYLIGGLGIGIPAAVLGDLIASLAAGFAGTIAVSFYEHAAAFTPLRTWVGSGLHVTNGLGVAFAAFLTVEIANRRAVPSNGLRWSRVWTTCGLGCGILVGFIAIIQLGRGPGVLVAVAATIAAALTGGVAAAVASNPESAVPPIVVLHRDRGAFLRTWLVFGVALGLITGITNDLSPGPTGHPGGPAFGIAVGLSNVIIPGLGLAFIQARWGAFTLARCWLALTGQLPWQLMTFLDDAYDRGVFRQVGAVYQFRHINLQRRIADWPAGSGRGWRWRKYGDRDAETTDATDGTEALSGAIADIPGVNSNTISRKDNIDDGAKGQPSTASDDSDPTTG
jgi:NACHT domain